MATLKRPETINRKAKIETLADVSAALHELAWLNAEKVAIESKAQKKLDAINKEARESMVVDVDGRDVPIAERMRLLESNVLAWCEPNLTAHLQGKAKTLNLPHGKLVRRTGLASIEFAEGQDEKTVFAAINETIPVLDKLNRILALMLGVFRLGSILKLSWGLNKPAIKTAWENQPDDRPALEALGLTLKPGVDSTSVKIGEYQIAVAD
jgi:phage host-nuclease inhibitor protein Gam